MELSLSNNPELRDLPLSLAECSQLVHISNKGTLIPQDSPDTLHEQWRAKRNQQLEKYHIQRIERWQKIANRQFPFLDQLQEGENGKLALVNEWLARLEKTKDYTTAQQARIAEVAMTLLQTACENEEFFHSLSIKLVQVQNAAKIALPCR